MPIEPIIALPGEGPPGARHGFRNDSEVPVRMLNVHAPAGFDRRIGLVD